MDIRQSLQTILDKGLVRRAKGPAGRVDDLPPITAVGVPSIDGVLPGGGLGRGLTHEWILEGPSQVWYPPVLLLAWLAARASGLVVWIGRRCWPTVWALEQVSLRTEDCIFVDPRDEVERVWVIDQSLRCGGVSAVVGDASGLDMSGSRRLQLAAEAGQTLGLLARAPSEAKVLSAAATRWRVRPKPSVGTSCRWELELMRCKAGVMWSGWARGAAREWLVEWVSPSLGDLKKHGVLREVAREAGGVRVAPDVAGGLGEKADRKSA
jgi:protein ImuA